MDLCIMHPFVYVRCTLSKVKGIRHGVWIEATQPVETMSNCIQRMLIRSPMPNADCFRIENSRGFKGFPIHRCESLYDLRLKALLVLKYGRLASQVFVHYRADLENTIEGLTRHYLGVYHSAFDFAVSLFKEFYRQDCISELIHYQLFYEAIFKDDYFAIGLDNKSHIFVQH